MVIGEDDVVPSESAKLHLIRPTRIYIATAGFWRIRANEQNCKSKSLVAGCPGTGTGGIQCIYSVDDCSELFAAGKPLVIMNFSGKV